MRPILLPLIVTTLLTTQSYAAETTIEGRWQCSDKSVDGALHINLNFRADGQLDTRLELVFEEDGLEIRGVVQTRSTYELLSSGILKDKTTQKELISLTADGYDIKNHPDAKELRVYLLAEDDTPTNVVDLTKNKMVLTSNGETISCNRTRG
ncbi:hypothetical protein [uncultured Shimia sp.]|uniref:hypothetical protein n=1 Tax=uncultured Shimia sp. TaxID=573152 RepID=UPI0025EF2AD9|nr:hypothetical protein [uncultured Shimia sp.]